MSHISSSSSSSSPLLPFISIPFPPVPIIPPLHVRDFGIFSRTNNGTISKLDNESVLNIMSFCYADEVTSCLTVSKSLYYITCKWFQRSSSVVYEYKNGILYQGSRKISYGEYPHAMCRFNANVKNRIRSLHIDMPFLDPDLHLKDLPFVQDIYLDYRHCLPLEWREQRIASTWESLFYTPDFIHHPSSNDTPTTTPPSMVYPIRNGCTLSVANPLPLILTYIPTCRPYVSTIHIIGDWREKELEKNGYQCYLSDEERDSQENFKLSYFESSPGLSSNIVHMSVPFDWISIDLVNDKFFCIDLLRLHWYQCLRCAIYSQKFSVYGLVELYDYSNEPDYTWFSMSHVFNLTSEPSPIRSLQLSHHGTSLFNIARYLPNLTHLSISWMELDELPDWTLPNLTHLQLFTSNNTAHLNDDYLDRRMELSELAEYVEDIIECDAYPSLQHVEVMFVNNDDEENNRNTTDEMKVAPQQEPLEGVLTVGERNVHYVLREVLFHITHEGEREGEEMNDAWLIWRPYTFLSGENKFISRLR